MSRKSANKLIVQIKVSPALVGVFTFLHASALLILCLIDVSVEWRVALALALLASLYRALTHHALRSSAAAVRMLQWNDRNGLSLRRAKDDEWDNAALRGRFVHRWLVLLSLQPQGKWFSSGVVITADAIEAEAFRRLRAILLAPPRMQEE